MQMLTINEAAKLTGKHPDTIRRLVKRLLKENSEANTNIKQELINGGFSYQIAKEYLLNHIPVASAILEEPMQSPMYADMHTKFTDGQQTPQENLHSQKQAHTDTHTAGQVASMQTRDTDMHAYRETIDILKDQLKQKDRQIEQLLERDRETNILLKGYQDKYLLENPKEQRTEKTTEVDVPSKEQPMSTKAEQKDQEKKRKAKPASSKAHKPKSTKQEQPKKKGFFSFLTGK